MAVATRRISWPSFFEIKGEKTFRASAPHFICQSTRNLMEREFLKSQSFFNKYLCGLTQLYQWKNSSKDENSSLNHLYMWIHFSILPLLLEWLYLHSTCLIPLALQNSLSPYLGSAFLIHFIGGGVLAFRLSFITVIEVPTSFASSSVASTILRQQSPPQQHISCRGITVYGYTKSRACLSSYPHKGSVLLYISHVIVQFYILSNLIFIIALQ